MDSRLENAKELLRVLNVKTCKSPVVIARRTLCAQEYLVETRKKLEVLA